MGNFDSFKKEFLRNWHGELPPDDKIKSAYFEYISRVNRQNYNDRLNKKIKNFKELSTDGKIKYVLLEILIYGGGLMLGAWLTGQIFDLFF